MKRFVSLLSVLALTGIALATVINVPGDYATIQAGVNAAGYGDTVSVAPGTYVENVQLNGGSQSENITLLGSGWENTTIDGGGLFNTVYVYQISNFTIEGFTVRNAQQSGSAPGNVGVHLNPQSSFGTLIVRHCNVTHNGHGIQIWNDFGGAAYIEHNIISDNLYNGFYPYLGTVYLTNNTIVDNGQDGYNDWSGGGTIYIKNNIIANNGRYGIYKHLNTPVFISYNDVWNNADGAYYQGYSGPAQPFTPNPGTGEIAADPLFYGSPFDYFISWDNFPTVDPTMSPCIDAGDPTLPSDPDGTTADQGAFYFDQTYHQFDVTLTPLNPPIQIPATGGSFDYDVALRNLEYIGFDFDVWIMAQLPNGSLYGPILGPVEISILGTAVIERTRTQYIPAGAPPGSYSYIVNAGIYPTTIWDSGSFPFNKSSTGDGTYVDGWFCSGESFAGGGIIESDNTLPSVSAILSAYPNPFNPVTAISFLLQDADLVKLQVFDVQGKLVGELVNGWRDEGLHEVTFDASHLSSGVYIYRLSAGNFKAEGKMVLMK